MTQIYIRKQVLYSETLALLKRKNNNMENCKDGIILYKNY